MPRLLIIEDDSLTRELLRRQFDRHYTLTCVGSGQDGLDALESGPFDLVLLDVMMPGMNGFTVLERIRENPATADLPVILISGLTDNETIVQGLQLGANDYLTKPINVHVADARLRTQLKLKQLLDERKQAIAELERLSQLREHFFRIASHDLKNPLANLRLAVHELSYFVEPNAEAESIQAVIDTTLNDMHGLIEDFLDLAALQNPRLELAVQYVELKDCIGHVVAQFDRVARRKHITLVVGDTDGVVLADRLRLIQVIGNLVSNAIKFSPAHTTVTLWTEVVAGRARLYVRDEGPGVTLEEQQRLFAEFAKGSTRPTGGESSTGLGLWIVAKLVELLNGEVGLESSSGAGALFWIELPSV